MSWSGSDKDTTTGRESPDSCSGTSSNSLEEPHKRRYSVRPPPGSPKKSPSKKVNMKNTKSMVNKMEYVDDQQDEQGDEKFTKLENADE